MWLSERTQIIRGLELDMKDRRKKTQFCEGIVFSNSLIPHTRGVKPFNLNFPHIQRKYVLLSTYLEYYVLTSLAVSLSFFNDYYLPVDCKPFDVRGSFTFEFPRPSI